MHQLNPFHFVVSLVMILIASGIFCMTPILNAQERESEQTTIGETAQDKAGPQAEETSEMTTYQHLDEAFSAADTLEKREQAMVKLRELLKTSPDDAELLWRAARMAWFIGDWLDDDTGPKLENIGREGMDYAERALKIQPDNIEAHYYMAMALSAYSRGISIVKALMKGLAGTFEHHLQWVQARDKAFDRGGVLRALGRYYWKLPWPKNDYKKSIYYLDQALEVAPDVLRTHLYRGDTLWALKRYHEAKESYEYVLATNPTDFDLKDAAFIKKEADLQLKKLIAERFSSEHK